MTEIKDIKIGTYEIGYNNVQLVLSPGRSGSFNLNPGKEIAVIKIGGEHVKWQDLYSVLLHEVLEFALTRENCRYVGTQDLSCETGAYVFAHSHAQFANCCAQAAEFLTECYKDLKLTWIRFKITNKIGRPDMVTTK